jgi:hypothetical protein
LVTGAALGAGSSLWVERRVRRTIQQATARLQPDALVVEVGRSARQVAGSAGERWRGAVSSGRDEMLRREEELWAELAAQGVDPAPWPGTEAGTVAPRRPAGVRVPSGTGAAKHRSARSASPLGR